SDLASLKTRAVRDGDEWAVTGQKVWTTFAHHAKWCMLVARTDSDAPKHKGLTYFLMDMEQDAVQVRPLRQITGESEFNELLIEAEVLRLNAYRSLSAVTRTGVPGPEGSLGKWHWSEVNQALTELAVEIAGPRAMLADSEWTYRFLRARANSIEGGTTEILKNIVAERVLGLPRMR